MSEVPLYGVQGYLAVYRGTSLITAVYHAHAIRAGGSSAEKSHVGSM